MSDKQLEGRLVHVTDIGAARAHLFSKLAKARLAYAAASQPEDIRAAWIETLAATHRFLAALEPPGDELHPLTMLGAALMDLNSGASPDALAPSRTKKGGRPPITREKLAQFALAAAAVDRVKELGKTLDEACALVAKEIGKSKSVVKNFRRCIYDYGDEAVAIRNKMADLFRQANIPAVLAILRQRENR